MFTITPADEEPPKPTGNPDPNLSITNKKATKAYKIKITKSESDPPQVGHQQFERSNATNKANTTQFACTDDGPDVPFDCFLNGRPKTTTEKILISKKVIKFF